MIEELKAENKVLQEKASHSDYFSTMYKVMAHFLYSFGAI